MSQGEFHLVFNSDSIRNVAARLKTDTDYRNTMGRCPCCNTNIRDRKVTLFRSLIHALYTVYDWCQKNGENEFTRKEIRHLLPGHNEYARFGDLIRFGGVVYKPVREGKKLGRSHFGINMTRAHEFFSGKRRIPVQITINQITNERIESNYVHVKEFPSLSDLLTKDGLYDPHKKI